MAKKKGAPPEISLIREALGEEVASYEQVKAGQDGIKFIVKTESGEKLFCRVKSVREGQELPFQEAEVLMATTSRHIIRPSHIDTVRGHYIIARPFIEGVTLAERMGATPLTAEETARLASALVGAVENLQEVGAVHFDIKPENIVAANDGEFYLIDFGAAKIMKRVRDERLHPARRYIAPEVLEYLFNPSDTGIQRMTTLTDMYGVGGVLYEALTGRRLSDFFAHSSDVLQKVPPPVRHVIPDADPRLADLADRLLAKNPSRRLLPRHARELLAGNIPAAHKFPPFLLRTKGGRGSEHSSMLPTIAEEQDRAGVYWKSGTAPTFPHRSLVLNVLWEPDAPDTIEQLEHLLLAQQQAGVLGLCVPSHEIESPLVGRVLDENVALVDAALEWRRRNAPHLPVLAVLSLDASLLLSRDSVRTISDAYAARDVDGLILRACISTYGEILDARHMRGIRELIGPWAGSGRPVLYDGDLNALLLRQYGVTTLVSATSPRQQILVSRRQPADFIVRPDKHYVQTFLGMVGPDRVISLRATPLGRTLTNCGCRHCAATLMRRRPANWTRTERRKHFVSVIPNEMDRMRTLRRERLLEAIANARREIGRFRQYIPIEIPHLDTWFDFLS